MSAIEEVQSTDEQVGELVVEIPGQEQETPSAEQENYISVLEVWKNVLDNVDDDAANKPTFHQGLRLINTYRDVHYKDIPLLLTLWREKVSAMRDIVAEAIEIGDLEVANEAEDRTVNDAAYRQIITEVEKLSADWEDRFDFTHPDAAIEAASIPEAYQVFHGNQHNPGLVAHLATIGFQFTQEDQEALVELLAEHRNKEAL